MGKRLSKDDIEERLAALARRHGCGFRPESPDAVGSDVFLIGRLYREGGVMVDLGGGISARNGVLAQLGMTIYVVDLLSDYWECRPTNATPIAPEIKLLEACGVQFIHADVSTFDFATRFANDSVDVVASLHCLEHLHQSPKLVLESAMRALKPGGLLLIEVPNAANIRKRVALLMGRTNYTAYNSYYHSSPYVGHVREYTVGDLGQLARNVGASRYRIFGRNSVYGHWVERVPYPIRRLLDGGLQCFPGLCSSLLLEVTRA
jgi:SAM-dependent methyltransferase